MGGRGQDTDVVVGAAVRAALVQDNLAQARNISFKQMNVTSSRLYLSLKSRPCPTTPSSPI